MEAFMKPSLVLFTGLWVLSVAPVQAADVTSSPSSSHDSGMLSGRVVDIADNVLPGASIAIEPRGLRLVTDREGRFTTPGLPAGEYKVEISYVGFKDDEEDIKLEAGS